MKPRICFLLVAFTFSFVIRAQEVAIPGLDGFKKYDKSYVTPELKKQPGISIGYNMAFHVPMSNHFEPEFSPNHGFRISYNHMFSRRGGLRRRLDNQIFRERFQFGFGGTLQMDFTKDGDLFGSVYGYYFRPIIRINLGLVKFSLLNEYGLGVGWRPRTLYPNEKTVSPIVALEGFRFQLLSIPIIVTASTIYSLRNNVFGKAPLDVAVLLSARMYFYDYADKKKQ